MAAHGVVFKNLNLKPGHCVKIKGFIPEDCTNFAINMGQDASNFLLHFNPRFNFEGETHKIICNTKEADVWKTEERENAFPFQQGTETSFCIEYQADKFVVKLPSGEQFSFPVRKHLDAISYLNIDGLKMKSVTME